MPLEPRSPETEARTHGYSVIDFATDVLQVFLFPWQRWLLIHALELRPDGGYRFRNVVVLVARQNGKSTLSQVLALWWLYVQGNRLVLGTAQDLDTATEVWDGAVALATETDDDGDPIRPELADLTDRVIKTNGSKSLVLLKGERYKVKAANRQAGRGLSGDKILLDELREQKNWDAWSAITKTTMARPNAQVWCLSNAGDRRSVVLHHLRLMAHRLLGDPDGIVAASPLSHPDEDADATTESDLFLAEWSAPPECSVWDREAWAAANPSMNHVVPGVGKTITDRTVASAVATDPDHVVRTEVLCQWVETAQESPFGAGKWELCAGDRPAGVPLEVVGVAADRTSSSIVAAGRVSVDGVDRIAVKPLKTGSGTAWLLDEVVAQWVAYRKPVVIDSRDPAADLIPHLLAKGVRVIVTKTAEYLDACSAIFRMVVEKQLLHESYPELDSAVAGATTRPVGDRWAWDQKSSTAETAPLKAASLAAWWVEAPDEQVPPPPPRPQLTVPTAVDRDSIAVAGF